MRSHKPGNGRVGVRREKSGAAGTARQRDLGRVPVISIPRLAFEQLPQLGELRRHVLAMTASN